MTPKRIFITGASGCIGHYLTEALIQNTQHELFLLVRNPAKLQFNLQYRPGITVLQGDLRCIEEQERLLGTINVAILAATAWGGAAEVYDVNVTKTLALLKALDPAVCEQVLYFSTESILDNDNELLKQAYELGTDYIRTKYLCFGALQELAIAPRITALFPTLVFGGDAHKPYSHLTAGLPEAVSWLWLARFLNVDASFHFIHAYDIAQVVQHLVEHPPQDVAPKGKVRQMVLGNAPITVNQVLDDACRYFHKRRWFSLSVQTWFVELLIWIFRIQVAVWDRFCIRYRHFVHRDPVNPSMFGLPTYGATLADLLKLSGIMPEGVRGKGE